MFLSCFYFCSLFFCWSYINSSSLFCQYFLLIYFIFYYFQNIMTSKLKDQKPDAVSLTKRRPQAFAKFNPGFFWPTAGRSCSLRNSTESSFQKRRTKDSAVFAFRKVQRSIFPIFFLLFYKWANIEFCTNLSHKLKSFFEWGAAFYEAVQVCKLFLL